MTQVDASPSSQQEPPSPDQRCSGSGGIDLTNNPEILSLDHSTEKTSSNHTSKPDKTTFFPVTGSVTFKSLAPAPEQEARHLAPSMAQLVSLVSLGAVVLLPLNGCSGGDSSLPCPVPASNSAKTPVPHETPTIKCTTSGGTHYVWFPSHGGWVQSDDGTHPNSNAHGVGEDSGHSGIGGGSDGTGHGGSDGG